jgi:hypothetical protein
MALGESEYQKSTSILVNQRPYFVKNRLRTKSEYSVLDFVLIAKNYEGGNV